MAANTPVLSNRASSTSSPTAPGACPVRPSRTTSPSKAAPSAIVVTDPGSIPLHPTLATLGGAAPSLLFSSAGTPGTSGAGQAGAASVTQVAAGAKTLYKSPGVLNTDRSSRLDAAPFAPFVGATSDKRAPQLTVIAASAGPIDVTTRSEKSGPAAETFVSGSFEGSVQDATVGGSSAQDSFAPATGSVGYSGSTTAPVSLNVDRMTGTGPVDASITTSSGHGYRPALDRQGRDSKYGAQRAGDHLHFDLVVRAPQRPAV